MNIIAELKKSEESIRDNSIEESQKDTIINEFNEPHENIKLFA